TDFDYIPGAQPFALGPFEHLFAGPGCAYETLNPTQLVSEIERLREAGHRPAINSVPHVALCEFIGLRGRGGMQVFTFEKTAMQEPEGFMEAMMATLSDDGYEPPLLIEWLGANMSDADREDVRANGF
ncbi:hypothetical protein TeGR_g7672, partial [Tetraparma gracilis]